MPIIYCAIHPFDYITTIRVYSKDEAVFEEVACNLEEIFQVVPSLAQKYNITKIILGGGKFGAGFAEEIQTEAAMKYNINNLEIEVI